MDIKSNPSILLLRALASPGIIDTDIVLDTVFEYGCPEDDASMRPLLWKLCLGYLPFDKTLWPETLKSQREMYATFTKELITNPFEAMFSQQQSEIKDPTEDLTDTTATTNTKKDNTIRTPLKTTAIDVGMDPLSAMSSTHRAAMKEQESAAKAEAAVISGRNGINNNGIKKKKKKDKHGKSIRNENTVERSVSGNLWGAWDGDNTVRLEIHKDVTRTYSTFHFFQQKVNVEAEEGVDLAAQRAKAAEELRRKEAEACATASVFEKARQRQAAQDNAHLNIDVTVYAGPTHKDAECHSHVLERILFIYAKLNPGVRYVQGMNELLAPIYYVYANSSDPDDKTHAEADVFFSFSLLMSHIRDRFIKSLDDSDTGVMASVAYIDAILKAYDPLLQSHLQDLNIDPRFYAFRWLTLLMSQEFLLPDVLRLWDSFFADLCRENTNLLASPHMSMKRSKNILQNHQPMAFASYTCVAMVALVRNPIMAGGFTEALTVLQRYPPVDVTILLRKAIEIRTVVEYGDPNRSHQDEHVQRTRKSATTTVTREPSLRTAMNSLKSNFDKLF